MVYETPAECDAILIRVQDAWFSVQRRHYGYLKECGKISSALVLHELRLVVDTLNIWSDVSYVDTMSCKMLL